MTLWAQVLLQCWAFPHRTPAARPPRPSDIYANMNLIDQELNSSKNHFMAFFVTSAMNPNFFWVFFFFFFPQANGPKQQNKHFSFLLKPSSQLTQCEKPHYGKSWRSWLPVFPVSLTDLCLKRACCGKRHWRHALEKAHEIWTSTWDREKQFKKYHFQYIWIYTFTLSTY